MPLDLNQGLGSPSISPPQEPQEPSEGEGRPQPCGGEAPGCRAGPGLWGTPLPQPLRPPAARLCFRPLKSRYSCSSFHSTGLSWCPLMPAKA